MRTMRTWVMAAGLVPALLLMAGPASAQQPTGTTLTVSPDGRSATTSVASGMTPPFAESRVIVRFRAGTSFLPGSGRSVLISPAQNVHLVDSPAGASVAQVLARYQANPNVVYAEPDYTVSAILSPSDPDYTAGKQWDMTKIAAPAAWDLHTDSSAVVVAVVDTGIDYAHPDLQGNLYTDAADAALHGYTCMSGRCVAGGADDHGHGTHVAGTIGAATNNGTGMAGINWNVRLLAIKFLSSSGSGSTSDAVLGFNLLTTLKQAGVNIRVTNNSWGGGGFSQALKDAMAALEQTPGYPGTLNVCAAGNSGVTADFSPMWPGAFDNRGIVSVLATDSADAGASFTNFGVASVDIAAPGVNTYSTSPSGTCSLCDPSGYRTLSGTSMASPHVAGVAAALLARQPLLTAAQARDALLHPGSYDWMTNAKAQSTSSGGRLNFYKALTNYAFLDNPVLNNFPSVSLSSDVFTTAGGTVNFTASASDPDATDTLRIAMGQSGASTSSTWLFGWELNQLMSATVPFTAPALARTAAMSYSASAADNRGGGASARSWAIVEPVASPGGPPAAALTVPATGVVGTPVSIGVSASDPEGKPIGWDLWASGNGGSSGVCCYTGSSASMTFNSAGVYRISVQAIDRELNTSPPQTAVISIGGATGVPPIAAATLDRQSGPVPLTVNIDMSGSVDPDGSISSYYLNCGGGYTAGTSGATGTCNFTTPGVYWLLLQVRDAQGYMGLTSKYVVATPAGGTPPPPDVTAPSLSITSPAPGANLTGTVNLQASATDNTGGAGMREVEYYLDAPNGASLGKATTAPYTVAWNTGLVAPGAHTIYAIARDAANNASAPVAVAVSVYVVVPPAVSLSPSGSVTVQRKASLTLSASITNTPTFAISRVDFLVGGTVVCSDTTAAYSCAWKAPGSPRTLQAEARAYDSRGGVGASNVLTITVR